MRGLTRFASLGLRNAEQRLARWTTPEPLDEPLAIHIVESSVMFREGAKATAVLKAAARSSAAVAFARTACDPWRSADPPARWRPAGIVLLVASVVHTAMVVWSGSVHGWIWALVPGTAAAAGLLLLFTSTDQRR